MCVRINYYLPRSAIQIATMLGATAQGRCTKSQVGFPKGAQRPNQETIQFDFLFDHISSWGMGMVYHVPRVPGMTYIQFHAVLSSVSQESVSVAAMSMERI